MEPTGPSQRPVPQLNQTLATMTDAARACGFEILRSLGAGGMASVFLAMDQNLQRPVALKFPITTGRRTDKMVEMLKREAENAASLIHENIVQVYSWHEHNDHLFFAMELVEGETLLDRVRQGGPMEPIEALRIAMECANGLQAAHARGIIHHDIKPANIMIRHDGRVKVADLGISTNADDRSKLQQTMIVRGTTGFMAPEQARGEVTTPASDVYSLGVTLYYALTGKNAYIFPAGTPKLDRLKMNQGGQLRPLRESGVPIPRVVEKLVGQMLESAPSRRIPTMPIFVQTARKAFLGMETRPQSWVGKTARTVGRVIGYLKYPACFVAGGVAGAAMMMAEYEGTTVPRNKLRDGGQALLDEAARQTKAIYAANPTNGLIGTSAGLVEKARTNQDWPLVLSALEQLRIQGILKFTAPPGAKPAAPSSP